MTDRRSTLILVGAAAIAIAAGVLLRDTLGYAVRTETGWGGDLQHYVYWTRLVTLGGIQAAYGGTWPETYAVYPPITLYGYQVVGTLYRALVDPAFEIQRALESAWLMAAIKGAALVWHLLAGCAIFAMVRRRGPRGVAALAAATYLANPAALFDVAHWGQPDGAHSLFSVLAVGLIDSGVLLGGWVAMALAALAKPQAWAILPLATLATWRAGRLGGLVRATIAGTATAVVVLLPFLAGGRLGEFLSLPGTISTVMPVVTANAHNLWWLVLAQRGLEPLLTPEGQHLVGPLTYRMVGLALVGAEVLFTTWLYWTGRARLAESAALGALGWFVVTTQAHENHVFFALPLLALAWPARRTLLAPMAVLTVTLLLNMALHDQFLLEALGLSLEAPAVRAVRLANAAANVLCFAIWGLAAARRKPVRGLSGLPAESYTGSRYAEVAQG